MRIDHAVKIARDGDAGADFLVAHDSARQRSGAGMIVAGDVQLDAVDTFRHAQPSEFRYLHGPVGDDGEAVAELVRLAFVAQTAGDGNLRPTGAQSRSRQVAGVDRVADHHVDPQFGRRSAVAAGKPVIQQQPSVTGGDQSVLLRRGVAEVGGAGAADEGDVRVAFHQSRHQGHALGVNYVRPSRFKLADRGGDCSDPVVLDQNVSGVGGAAGAVPDAGVLEQCAGYDDPPWLRIDPQQANQLRNVRRPPDVVDRTQACVDRCLAQPGGRHQRAILGVHIRPVDAQRPGSMR